MSNTPNQYEELNDFNQIAERLLEKLLCSANYMAYILREENR
jgi:hypothetical protein